MPALNRDSAALVVARANRATGRSEAETVTILILLSNDEGLAISAAHTAYHLENVDV